MSETSKKVIAIGSHIMMNMKRPYLSPFLLVCYVSTSVTGILMLLHMGFPAIHPIHEWGGLAFVIGGLLHLMLNWRALTTYFKPKLRSQAIWGMVGCIVLITIIALFIPEQDHPRRQRLGNTQANMLSNHSVANDTQLSAPETRLISSQ